MTRSLALLATLTLCNTALAEDGERPDYEVSLTLSPLHLAVPAAELTLEWQAAEKLGIPFIAGIGHDGSVLWDLGIGVNGYLLGNFTTGLCVGAEYLMANLGTTPSFSTGPGLSGYVGGKYAFDFGLTGMAQVGVQYGFADFDIGAGELGPALNLGLGWSF